MAQTTEEKREKNRRASAMWRANNPEKRQESLAKWYYGGGREKTLSQKREKLYGITSTQYAEMLEAQNGVCAICKRPERIKRKDGTSRLMHVDHNHETGVVRGLLCNTCNAGIGLLEDDIDLLQSAIDYLKENDNGREV